MLTLEPWRLVHASVELLRAMQGEPPSVDRLEPACGADSQLTVWAMTGARWGVTPNGKVPVWGEEDTKVVACSKCLVLMDVALSGSDFPEEFAAVLQVGAKPTDRLWSMSQDKTTNGMWAALSRIFRR